MSATIEINTDVLRQLLAKRGWNDVQAARELGMARSTIHRLRTKQMGLSGDLIAAFLVGLSSPRQRPERLFEELFVIVRTPTKE